MPFSEVPQQSGYNEKLYIALSGDLTYEIRLGELNIIKQVFRPTN
jgi:hypothetical protein